MADRSTPSKKQAAGMSWMLLDRFVYRRDDDDGSFPDEAVTRIRSKSSTSLGDLFTVALLPGDPPALSRLYVQWPRGPGEPADPDDDKVTQVLTSHRRLFLLKTTCCLNVDKTPYRQDYFVFKAGLGGGNSLLKRLPPCTEPIVLPLHGKRTTMERMFHEDTVGLVRSSSSDEFAVVQLAKFFEIHPGWREMAAELCVFRPRLPSSKSIDEDYEGDVAEGKWEVLTLPIHHSKEEFSDLQGWSTDGAITFNNSICWVDYHHGGILSYTPTPLSYTPTPPSYTPIPVLEVDLISYIRLPIDNRPNNSLPSQYPLEMYRSLCVTGPKDNERLKFVDVARDDGAFFGMIRDGSSFTITCYTSKSPHDKKWRKDAVITSKELWHPKSHKSLIPQNAVLMFPVVNKDKPNLVYFLMPEPSNNIDKVSVVVIDIITKKAVSVSGFIEGEKDLCGKHADMGSIMYEVQDC